jgi:hypothetical protein
MKDWFTTDGLRKAYKGEKELYDFLYTIWNINTTESNSADITFSDFEKILNGDFTELKSFAQTLIDNKMNEAQVLFGVKKSEEKFVQAIYTGAFANIRQKKFTKILKNATAEYGFNAIFDANNISLKTFDETQPILENSEQEQDVF